MKKKSKLSNSFMLTKKSLRAIGISLMATSIIVSGLDLEVKAASENANNNNSIIFESFMNNTISIFKANSKEEHSSILNLLSLNPLKVMHKELAFLEFNNIKEEFIDDKEDSKVVEEAKVAEEIAINPFTLNDNSITKAEKPSVDVVGNPQDNSKKKILIYHSHTTEAYDLKETRKMDLTQTVAGVGDELAKEFEKQGFTVIHDKTIHDLDYNSAYAKSRATMNNYFKKFGDFDFVVDLHRDAGPAKENVTAKVNNENVARLVIVTTTSDPRYKAHMKNINAIFSVAKEKYPNLFREKNLHTNYNGQRYYNQDLSDNALLLEVGATSNTVQEAKNSMKYVARVVAEVINQRGK